MVPARLDDEYNGAREAAHELFLAEKVAGEISDRRRGEGRGGGSPRPPTFGRGTAVRPRRQPPASPKGGGGGDPPPRPGSEGAPEVTASWRSGPRRRPSRGR